MSNRPGAEHQDDAVLIDFLTGNLDGEQSQTVRERLSQDEQFAHRSGKIAHLLKLLDLYETPEPDEQLIRRTLASVESSRRAAALAEQEVGRPRHRPFPTFSLRELISVAAILVLAGTILYPSLRQAQSVQKQARCMAQTGAIGTALTHYANDNGGWLPYVGGAAWLWEAPAPQRVSNSQNLWRLVVAQYAQPTLFQCPAVGVQPVTPQPRARDFPGCRYVSYSYQNSVNSVGLNIQDLAQIADAMAILADSTPIFVEGRFRRDRLGSESSPNHGGQGQAVLYLDRHVVWQSHGRVGVGGDNIWLASGVEDYKGTEQPANSTDSFLLPNCIDPAQPGCEQP